MKAQGPAGAPEPHATVSSGGTLVTPKVGKQRQGRPLTHRPGSQAKSFLRIPTVVLQPAHAHAPPCTKEWGGDRKLSQQVNTLATKYDNLGLTPRILVVTL